MSGKEILVDTNILLYLLDGNDTIAEMLNGKNLFISFITELELLGFKKLTKHEEEAIINLLDDCSILPMSNHLKDKCIEIRRKYSLKLPDAIVAATAISFDLPFITSDKQFKTVNELKLIAYEI
jgi:predicted nucleic acid-binding protein